MGPSHAPGRKYPKAGDSLGWQWLFPADKLSEHPRSSGVQRRHHVDETYYQRAVKAGMVRDRHPQTRAAIAFTTHLLEAGYDIRMVQELLGYKDVGTTMIHCRAEHPTLHSHLGWRTCERPATRVSAFVGPTLVEV